MPKEELKMKNENSDQAAGQAAQPVDDKRPASAGISAADSKEKDAAQENLERVVKISRVTKVVKGGKNMSFNALVVAGDGKGNVGIGFGKSNEVVSAIGKGTLEAKKTMRKVPMKGDTIPHDVMGRYKATKVFLKPANPGTGVIAGGPVRALCDCAGIKNILTKCLGSRNPINVVKATLDGFDNLRLKRRGQ
ncbi:MAG TPA: 30S ribosomal protein S5 [Candidatus Omnitrophota bacterium]|nr:30S ribosomal protein S5 [Candidatus Omnitrophota bacterium]